MLTEHEAWTELAKTYEVIPADRWHEGICHSILDLVEAGIIDQDTKVAMRRHMRVFRPERRWSGRPWEEYEDPLDVYWWAPYKTGPDPDRAEFCWKMAERTNGKA